MAIKCCLAKWLRTPSQRVPPAPAATCIAHDLNPRPYLHLITRLIVQGWPNAELRELLPDRMLVAHPELYVGERAIPTARGDPLPV